MKDKIIKNGIEYVRNGDYYIPSLKAHEGTYNIGRYGKLHSIFIKENRPALSPPSKNGHRKATKNGMNRSHSFIFLKTAAFIPRFT